MNIFIMILVFILMAGYFLIDAPNQRVRDDRIESALRMTEIKSIFVLHGARSFWCNRIGYHRSRWGKRNLGTQIRTLYRKNIMFKA